MFSCCRISIFYNIQTRALLQKVPYRIIHWIILHVYNHKLINEQSSSRYQLNSIILSYKSADTCHLFAAMFSYEVFASLITLSYIYMALSTGKHHKHYQIQPFHVIFLLQLNWTNSVHLRQQLNRAQILMHYNKSVILCYFVQVAFEIFHCNHVAARIAAHMSSVFPFSSDFVPLLFTLFCSILLNMCS
jgi:hypothetical protein